MTAKTKTFFYVTVPEPFKIQMGKAPKTGKPVTQDFRLYDLVEYLANTDSRFNKTGDGFRKANRLVELFEGTMPGEVVQVHPQDYTDLLAAAENPSDGMPRLNGTNGNGDPVSVPIGRGLQPVLDAIADATQIDPTEDDETDTDTAVETAADTAPIQ